jgi:hypothetical protein
MANELSAIVLGFFLVLFGGLMGYVIGALVESHYPTVNQSVCNRMPQGYINMSQGARLEGVTLYNLTLYAQDDNYTMKSVFGKDFVMIVNGTRIR